MRTIETNIVKFPELDESGKERARQWYRSLIDNEDLQFTLDEWKEFGAMLGIEIDRIYYSGFSSQGDGACFQGSYSYQPGWRKQIMAELGDGELRTRLLERGQELQDIQRRYFYGISASVSQSGHYMHSGCTDVSVDMGEHPTGYWGDTSDAEEAITDALRSFMDDIYWALEQEYDHLTSDEQVDEMIEINEHEFTEDGEIH